MMGHRERLISGSEVDAVSRIARKWMRWRAGERHREKATLARRERRVARLQLRKEVHDGSLSGEVK